MKKNILLCLGACLIFSSCVTTSYNDNESGEIALPEGWTPTSAYNIIVETDPYTHRDIVRMNRNDIRRGYTDYNDDYNNIKEFNLIKIVENGITRLYIAIEYRADDWLFIREGESLRILADGENISLHTVTSVYSELRTEDNRTYCYETVCYGITTEQVEAIVYAQDVSLRLCGYQFYDNFTLTRSNIEYIKESYNLYKNIGLIE